MTKNHKFVLSMATIAILSGTSAVAEELKVDTDKLKLGTTEISIKDGVADVTGKTTTIEVKTTIPSKIGSDTMTKLNVATSDTVTIGETSQSSGVVSIGGTKPTDTASTDGYGFDINAKSLTTAGAASSNDTQLNVNADSSITTTGSTTLGNNSSINIASGKTLTIGGALDASKSTISLGGGTLTANGKATLDGTKLTLDKGGTLNFNGTGSTISGAVTTEKKNALNINLSRGADLTFSGSLTLKNNEGDKQDEISLGGGTLNVAKLEADSTNILGAGTINFTEASSAQTADTGSKITNDFTIGSGTAMNLGKNVYLTLGGADKSVTTRGSKITFADSTSTLNVSNLNANASDFDMSKGGKLLFASDSESKISGNVALGEGQSYVFSAAGKLDLDSLALTKTGNIEFASKDSILNLSNGLTTDDAKTQIKITNGGTINFNGGTSTIKGKDGASNLFETASSKETAFNVKNATLNLENVKLTDKNAVLTLDGGVVNAAGLTTTAAESLNLKSGTLNFNQSESDKAKDTYTLTTSTIEADLDLSKVGASVNFNKGAQVKFTGTNGQLTASNVNLYGGEINLKKLTAATGESFSGLANLNFLGANASVNGNLSNTAQFSIGTDEKGNHFITKESETATIGTDSTLSLNSGTINANGTLKTEGGKLSFNGGNLIVGETGALNIDDTKNLEILKGGVLALKGANDGSKGGSATITKGDLDLSKGLNIVINDGASLTTTEASTISGKGQSITLGKYRGLIIDGSVKTSAGGKFEVDKVGNLELGKGTTLGIVTQSIDGVYKELEVGKLSTKAGETANLRFGAGSVELMGALDDTTNKSHKLNNEGFVSKVDLADDTVLNFNSGVVKFKEQLNAKTAGKATLKVSGATADLQGGLGANMTQIELSGGGALNLKGDYAAATNTTITTDGNSLINVDGAVSSAENFTFALLDTAAGNYTVLTSTKGVTGEAKAELRTRTSLNDILNKYGLKVETTVVTADNAKKVLDVKVADATTEIKDNNIVVKATSLESEIDTNTARSLQSLKASKDTSGMTTDIAALKTLKGTTSFVESSQDTEFQKIIDDLEGQKTATETAANSLSNTQIAQELGGGGVDSQILLSAYGSREGYGARDSITASEIGIDMLTNKGAGIVADIKEGASSSANMSSSTSSVMNTINLSNDMSISGRIAQANNPFASYASFDGLLYAAGTSDLPLYYANNGYMNGFWANAIGGLNKVEGENGTLVGLSVGFDRQLENTLVGFYLSYAMAGLNDKVVEQGSDNIQVGVYTSFNQRDIEVNVKAYGQLAVTNTTAKRGAGEAEAKFNRLYGGVSANIGAIFAFNNNQTFVKPYIGENYYYAHTPAYEETRDSDGALSVQSANNHALSFDVGVDVRQYWNENSFVYLTPSIERYVVNSGGDYTAGFIGSDTSFTIEGKSKTKTYVQALLGGNIALGDKFNVNLGVGVKKILNGQIERANGDKVDEMYLSGNLGVKYRF